MFQLLVALAGVAFALLTLRLQSRRRRARVDATHRYWQLGLGASIGALLMFGASAILPGASGLPGWSLFFGCLLAVGGFLPFICGMLYKIVPFLAWLHLQNSGQGRVVAPAMNKLLSEAAMMGQMKAHAAALGLSLGAVLMPAWLARPAGLALVVDGGWLAWNLFGALRRYSGHRAAIIGKLGQA